MRDKVYLYAVIRMGFSSEATFYTSPCWEGAVCTAQDLARLEPDDYHEFYVMKMPCGKVLQHRGKRVYTSKKINRDFS